MNAFKFFDQRIRDVVKAPIDAYDENLVDPAFSPDTGKLFRGLTKNEKMGLRNLISGANAFFHNPVSHRFIEYDQATAETVVILVNFSLKMVDISGKEKTQDDL